MFKEINCNLPVRFKMIGEGIGDINQKVALYFYLLKVTIGFYLPNFLNTLLTCHLVATLYKHNAQPIIIKITETLPRGNKTCLQVSIVFCNLQKDLYKTSFF